MLNHCQGAPSPQRLPQNNHKGCGIRWNRRPWNSGEEHFSQRVELASNQITPSLWGCGIFPMPAWKDSSLLWTTGCHVSPFFTSPNRNSKAIFNSCFTTVCLLLIQVLLVHKKPRATERDGPEDCKLPRRLQLQMGSSGLMWHQAVPFGEEGRCYSICWKSGYIWLKEGHTS